MGGTLRITIRGAWGKSITMTEPTTEDESTLAKMQVAMQHSQEQIDCDQVEIYRLEVETRALKVETRELLGSLQSMVQQDIERTTESMVNYR